MSLLVSLLLYSLLLLAVLVIGYYVYRSLSLKLTRLLISNGVTFDSQSPFIRIVPPPSKESEPRIVIIGAGVSGILIGIDLLKRGIKDFVIYERNKGMGGTWFMNRYPGCGCDVPSDLYSYSFENTYPFKDEFADRSDLLAYFEYVAHKYGVDEYMRFNTEVKSVEFLLDSDNNNNNNNDHQQWPKVWKVRSNNWETGETTVNYCQSVIMCRGMLNDPSIPDSIPGVRDAYEHSLSQYRPQLYQKDIVDRRSRDSGVIKKNQINNEDAKNNEDKNSDTINPQYKCMHTVYFDDDYLFKVDENGQPLKPLTLAMIGTGCSGIQIGPTLICNYHYSRHIDTLYIIQRTLSHVMIRPRFFNVNQWYWNHEWTRYLIRLFRYIRHDLLIYGLNKNHHLIGDFHHKISDIIFGDSLYHSSSNQSRNYHNQKNKEDKKSSAYLHSWRFRLRRLIGELLSPVLKIESFAANIERLCDEYGLIISKERMDYLKQWLYIPDFPIGCKRINISDDWLRMLTKPNVKMLQPSELVSFNSEGMVLNCVNKEDNDNVNDNDDCDSIKEPELLRTVRLDGLILATGYNSEMLGSMSERDVKVCGRQSRSLNEEWSASNGGGRCLKTVTSPGFPNLFHVSGPHCGLAHSSMIFMYEVQSEYICAILERMYVCPKWVSIVECKQHKFEEWNEMIDRNNHDNPWESDRCQRTWYRRRGVSVLWPFSSTYFWWLLFRVDWSDFVIQGF